MDVRGKRLAVAHDNQLHWVLVLHFDCVDAVNPREETRLVRAHSLEVGLLDPLERCEVRVGHGFDDETLVFAEEEKAARLALGFACFEYHVLISLRVKRLQKNLVAVAISVSQECKNVRLPLRDLDVLVDDQLLIILRLLRVDPKHLRQSRQEGASDSAFAPEQLLSFGDVV